MSINMADADCHFGDHFWGPGGVNCSNCGEVNVPNLIYKGQVGRVMKRTGLAFAEAEALMFDRAAARAIVSRKLGVRLAFGEARS